MHKTLITLNDYERIVHLKGRRNAWSRLYSSLLESVEWLLLSGEQAKLLIGLYRLALQTDNKIPNAPGFLKQACGLYEEPDVDALIPTFIKLRPVGKVADGGKKSYGEEGHVKLTEGEFNRLGELYGDKARDALITRLDQYADIKPKKFNQYVRHYKVIQNWHGRDKDKTGDSVDPGGQEDKKAVEAAKQAYLNDS